MLSIALGLILALTTLGFVFTSAGCRTLNSNEKSDVKVVDGVETADFPAVRHIYEGVAGGDCTGTFISPNTMITAAHCLGSLPNPENVIYIDNKEFNYKTAIHHGPYGNVSQNFP